MISHQKEWYKKSIGRASVEFLLWLNGGTATTVLLFVIVFFGGNWWRDIDRGKLRKKHPSCCIQWDKNIANLKFVVVFRSRGRRGGDHGCFDRAISAGTDWKDYQRKDVMQAFTKISDQRVFRERECLHISIHAKSLLKATINIERDMIYWIISYEASIYYNYKLADLPFIRQEASLIPLSNE